MNRINLRVEGRDMNVPRAKYVAAKTKQLREFGYTDLKETEVDAQITKILEGGTLKGGQLDIIGGFMEGEVIP